MAIREASPRIKTIKTVWKTTSFVSLSSVTLFILKKFDPDRGPPLLLSTHEDREKRLGSRGSAWLRQWGSAALCLPRVSLFFSLCSFRLYLGSVWFASTRRCSGPNSLSLSLSLLLFLHYSPLLRPSSVLASREPRPSTSVPLPRVLPPLHPLAGPRGYQPLVFTSGQLGGDFDKTTSKLNPPARLFPPQIPLEPARALTLATATSAPCVGRGRSERRGGERGGSRDLHSISSRTQGKRKPEKKVHRRVDAHVQEDLSKQKPGLSSSHVLGARRRSGEGGEMWRGTSVVADGGARGAGEEGKR